MVIRTTELDGVPTLVAPTSGPMHAGLTFRVGRADETLARTGITHLVEHLALHRLGLTDYHYNGATGAVVTHFHSRGPDEDVVRFLAGVCDALADLPVDRLETEKAILRTEWSSRSASVIEPMAAWRYGARDHGLTSYPEWGLPMLTAEDLRWWAANYFTRDNAVLWIAGDGVPAGLTLRLPGGARRPVPPPSCALPMTPAYFQGSSRAVAFEGVVRRRAAASVFAGVLERQLFRTLRQESGLSYTAATAYEPRGDGYASVVALADALPEKQDAVLGGFVDVLAMMRVGRIERADLDAVVAKARDGVRGPDVAAGRLQSCAFDLLTGHPAPPVAEFVAELQAVTPADVREVAGEALGSALLMVPHGRTADWAGFVAAPAESDTAVTGTRYASRQHPDVGLVVGPEGASLVAPDGYVTVRYAACSALLAWPDGARQLVGHDAVSLKIEPTLFELHPAAVQLIDASVPPAARVYLPARDPDSIPVPRPAAGPADAGPAAPTRSAFERTTTVVVSVFAVLMLGLAILATAATATDPESDAGVWAVVGCLWVVTVMSALPAAVLLRRRRPAPPTPPA